MDKIYYINLDKSTDRKEHLLSEFKRENVPEDKVQRFSAIDGSTHKFTEEELFLFGGKEQTGFYNPTTGRKMMGCTLSHHYVMEDIVKNKYPLCLVIQDDSILKNNFMEHIKNIINELPDNAEMVNIGFHKIRVGARFVGYDLNNETATDFLCKRQISKHVCFLNNGINPCSLAYIITLKGAQNILNYFKKNCYLRNPDENFNQYLEKKDVFYGPMSVLVTGNSLLKSTIWY